MRYDPRDWYWTADDGRTWSSVRFALVPADDPGLAEHKARVGYVTPWPRDDAGQQTDDALAAVLMPYGLDTSGPLRMATGAALIGAMTDDQARAWQVAVGSSKLSVQSYWSSAYRDLVPETNPKLVKLAVKAEVDLKALFDAALER